MAVDALQVWRDELEDLPKVADNSWAANFAKWYADRIISITTDPSALDVTTGFTFVFNESLFASKLITLTPTTDALQGITGFAEAWEAAILTTVFPGTLNVAAGAFIPPTSSTTLFSSITSVIIDPTSIATAKAKIIELKDAELVTDTQDSEFPVKFREATLLLTITVVGFDSTSSPGPAPLTALNIPLI